MIYNVNRLRKPYNPYEEPAIGRVLRFMEEHGHTAYKRDIDELREHFGEVRAEAGPGGPDCPVTQEILDHIDREIAAVADSAVLRYFDWATDF